VTETIDQPAATETKGFAALDASDLNELGSTEPATAVQPETAGAADVPLADGGPPVTGTTGAPPEEAALDAPVAEIRAPSATGRRSGTWRRRLVIVCGAVLVVGGGAWATLHFSNVRPAEQPSRPPAPEPAATVPAAPTSAASATEVEAFEWEGAFREIDSLRTRLAVKRDEILRLQRHYDYGVRELEEEAVRLIKESGCGSLVAALKDKPLELLLMGIQRRQSYRDALELPLKRLELGGEELLFLGRRARFDLQVWEVAPGIDMQAHRRAIGSALQTHEPGPETLSIREAQGLPPLEAVWRRLSEQAKQTVISVEDRLSHDIISEACAGNLGRVADLPVLTLKGANCLSDSGARELFLNRLKDLPPLAAQKLAEWPGRWLCLNGLRRLPLETARALFAWPGEWISLNGLNELTPEAAGHLVGWRGHQLELMGLRKTTALDQLAEWEGAGGKLFVPGDIRREMDARRRPGVAPGLTDRISRR
jgi:hypothetical protein